MADKTLESLNINLIDEIISGLKPREIVSLIGVNKYFYQLGDIPRITKKIFLNKQFTFEASPRNLGMAHQLKLNYKLGNQPELKHIDSCKKIYVLNISYDSLTLVLFFNDKISIWKPDTDETIIVEIDVPYLTNFSIHALAFENNQLAIMHTNNVIRFIKDGKHTQDLEIDGIDHLSVTKMFYLSKGSLLIILFSSGNVIFLNNNCEVVSNRNLGFISKYKILPGRKDAFIALIKKEISVITPNLTQVLCVFTELLKFPDFGIDEKQKKIIIHNPGKKGQCIIKAKNNLVDLNDFNGKMFMVQNHKFIGNPIIGLKDLDAKRSYDIHTSIEDVLGDEKIMLLYTARKNNTQKLQLFLWEEKNPFYTKVMENGAEILAYKFPYIIYLSNTDEGMAEISVLKL